MAAHIIIRDKKATPTTRGWKAFIYVNAATLMTMKRVIILKIVIFDPILSRD